MINIAIMGLGVVGMGSAVLLSKNQKLIEKRIGDKINIKYILDLREFPDSEFGRLVVHDVDIIANDPDVSIVAEMMGGSHPAYEFTKKMLLAGKSVVTSNKELVANYGAELLSIAREHGACYSFEASVGGGIPIIRPLSNDFSANDIYEIDGVLNGTSNYILTQMFGFGKEFSVALKEAQEKGYAEKDPTDDVDGIDTRRKMCVLTAMAYGMVPAEAQVLNEGIRTLRDDDVKLLIANDYRVKLIGRIIKDENEKIHVLVAPHIVSESCPLYHLDNVYNGVLVKGNFVGDVMFYGRGAGAEPTASAICADIVNIACDKGNFKLPSWHNAVDEIAPAGEFPSRYYVHISADKNSVSDIEKALGKIDVLGDFSDGFAFITQMTNGDKLCAAMDSLPQIKVISKLRLL